MKTYPYPQDQIMEYLQEAADNGEVIQLTYYGGTRPGEARSVVPTTVYKTRFHGICIDSNIEKTYLYEKCYFPKMFGVQKRNALADTPSRFAGSSKRFDTFSESDSNAREIRRLEDLKRSKEKLEKSKKELADSVGELKESWNDLAHIVKTRGGTRPIRQTAQEPLTTEEKPSISQRGWFIFVWYVVFFPVGVTLTLVNPRYSKQKKAVIVLLFVAFLCVIWSMPQPQTPPA